ncbi:universal stress protein [Marivivens aquimaris]|uniref:universal stress protein n=1 Tax=Marivivens aquimaris TaxID=2774876 RepID=UPI001880B6D7|nr:universal stress protein [Marivivens aquimaris]
MSYKTVSVVVSDEKTDKYALATARDFAARVNAHLDVYCIAIDPTRYDPMPIGSSVVLLESSIQEAQEQAEKLGKWATAQLGPNMAKTTVETVAIAQMGIETAISRLTRYSDLIVVTKPYGPGRNALHVNLLESQLFGTDAPVLIVPDDRPVGDLTFARPVVAWNESDESLSAIRKSIPLLKEAKSVDMIMIDPPSHSPERSDPGGVVCQMLSRHGLRPDIAILARTMPKVSDVILRFAAEHANDLIVMGGYGTSRFREAILGGATREILENADLPILMAH